MTFMEFVPTGLVAAICVGLFGYFRARARTESAVRNRQLEEAADLLEIHAQLLNRFLNDKAAPDTLKRVLIDCSDAMSDRDVVLRFTGWMSSRPMTSMRRDALLDDKELLNELSRLKISDPNLADDFSRAILTVAVGSLLRWPESAALFEQIGARMAANPKGDIGLAVTAASFRTESSFGLSGQNHAMA